MNIALIIAGGKGMRMHQEIPKQFLTVNEKPVIVYTMEAFQRHADIDAIAVVCIAGWENILSAYARQYGITKLKHIIPGGENGQDSIRNGIRKINVATDVITAMVKKYNEVTKVPGFKYNTAIYPQVKDAMKELIKEKMNQFRFM